MGYFAQHAAEVLDGKLTALEALEDVASMDWQPRLRGLLGSFLFEGDDVFKPVRVLSGGERQRVALMRILLSRRTCCCSTNRRIISIWRARRCSRTRSAYPGAVVVVTHDRSLMASLATRVIEVEGGRVRLYPGGYDDYEAARVARARAESGETASPVPSPSPVPVSVSAPPAGKSKSGGKSAAVKASAARGSAGKSSGNANAAKRTREKELPRIEKDIEEREQALREVEVLLADPHVYADGPRARDLVKRYELLRSELESLWQRLGEMQ